MLIKLSESVQMVNMNLLAGEKDYPGKETQDYAQYQGKTQGIIVTRNMALILTSWLQALSSLMF
jgi:hypothetical protein